MCVLLHIEYIPVTYRYILIYFFLCRNIAVFDGQTAIFPPTIEENVEHVPHKLGNNQLLAHLFNALTGRKAMHWYAALADHPRQEPYHLLALGE
jgi:hypothetical protein